jgi:hypothetical protein
VAGTSQGNILQLNLPFKSNPWHINQKTKPTVQDENAGQVENAGVERVKLETLETVFPFDRRSRPDTTEREREVMGLSSSSTIC